jgi:AcrR family transcriptional regulator
MITRTARQGRVAGEQERERILLRAREVFAERGYWGTEVDDLLAAAAIDRESFQLFFADTDECFLAVFERSIEPAQAAIGAAVGAEASWPAQTRAGLRAMLEIVSVDPAGARVVLEQAEVSPPTKRRFGELSEGVAAFLREGRQLMGSAEQASATLETSLIGGVCWVLSRRLSEGRDHSVGELLDGLAAFLTGPYMG